MRAFRQLRDLPPDQRQAFLSSPEIAKRFSPEERKVLQGLADYCLARELPPKMRMSRRIKRQWGRFLNRPYFFLPPR